MKTTETIMNTLNVDEVTAKGILASAEEYTNRGKGLVFADNNLVERVAQLFKEKPIWLSAELNREVGWQFSQAVYYLRRQGWKIKTLALGGRMFAYKVIEMVED